MTGRPLTVTPEITGALCELLQKGEFFAHACAVVGVPPRTAHRWFERGQEDDAPDELVAFWQACARARAEGEKALVEQLLSMAEDKSSKDWKAIAWKLERLRGEIFHLTTKTELSGPGGKPIQIATGKDITAMTTEEVRALARGESRPSAGSSST